MRGGGRDSDEAGGGGGGGGGGTEVSSELRTLAASVQSLAKEVRTLLVCGAVSY